jgi:hypothetical protein
MWYTPVFSEGAWRVKDPNGLISAVGFKNERRAGRMASELNDARALHFRVMDTEVIPIHRRRG